MSLPPPNTFGLPDKFTSWREHQDGAVLDALDNEKRFTTQVMPTGQGKSPMYVSAGSMRGGRTAILTSTKGLQTQLMRDFSPMGMVDVRGKNAYKCALEHDGTTCDHAACMMGVPCALKDRGGCHYYDAVRASQSADLIVTNYAYWMTSHKYGKGLGPIDTLVCDEAHDSPDVVSGFMTIKLNRGHTFTSMLLPRDQLSTLKLEEWINWAKLSIPAVEEELSVQLGKFEEGSTNRDMRRQIRGLQSLKSSLNALGGIKDDWIVEVNRSTIEFAPVWPAPYCEKALFRGRPHIILTSATVNQKTVEMLGIDEEDNKTLEYPHSFPVENRQLIHIPTVRMNFRTTDREIQKWLGRIDQIIRPRLDRKGIVHTVSYKRRDKIITHSEYGDVMITHATQNAIERINEFKNAEPPKILVSPSVTTGFDFPGSECEYQIIGKIAYPDTRNKIVKARSKLDREYPAYIAAQQLVQCCGRGTRSKTDHCENFILDDNVLWFMKQNQHLMPGWFKQAFVRRTTVPKPRKKL